MFKTFPSSHGGYGAANSYNGNQPDRSITDKIISDPAIWDAICEPESEDEMQQEKDKSSTAKVTKKTIQENDCPTKQIDPIKYEDWEGESRVMKSQEIN